MKGKKIDPLFVAEYIEQCIGQKCLSPEEIIRCAEKEIVQIDEEIRAVERRKIRRSKLLDVVATFRKPEKLSKSGEVKLIFFHQIQHPEICQKICGMLKVQPVEKKQLLSIPTPPDDLNFCLKQLLEHKVISKIGDTFLRGQSFDEYVKFVLQES